MDEKTMKWGVQVLDFSRFDTAELTTRHGHTVEKWYGDHMRKESSTDKLRRALERGGVVGKVTPERSPAEVSNDSGCIHGAFDNLQSVDRLHRQDRQPHIQMEINVPSADNIKEVLDGKRDLIRSHLEKMDRNAQRNAEHGEPGDEDPFA